MKKIKWFEGHGRGYADKGGYRSDTFCDGRLSRQYIVYEISEEEYRLDLILRTVPTVYSGAGADVISNGTVTLGEDFRSFDAVEEFVSDFEAKFGPEYDFGPDIDEFRKLQYCAVDHFNIENDSGVGGVIKEGFKALGCLKIFDEYDLPDVKSVEDMVKIWEIVEILRNKPLPENLHLSEDQENRFAALEYFGKIF